LYVQYSPKSQGSIRHTDAYGKIFPLLQRDTNFTLAFDRINAVMFPSATQPAVFQNLQGGRPSKCMNDKELWKQVSSCVDLGFF